MQKISMNVIPRTIYGDIVGLPDPILLGITIHYYNHSDETLYMKIFGSGPSPWSSNAVELGSLASGVNAYINLDNFLSRTRPTEALTEELTLTLKGYTDSGYSDLKYEFSRACTIVFIKSDDGTWTTDFSDNFDDGTVQGWTAIREGWIDYLTFGVTTDYVLSTPYSCKMLYSHDIGGGAGPYQIKNTLYKEFTTPNKDMVFAILNVRNDASGSTFIKAPKYLEIKRDDVVLVHLGKLYDTNSTTYIPLKKWTRIVVPLPTNTILTAKIVLVFCLRNPSAYDMSIDISTWLDNFKIISK